MNTLTTFLLGNTILAGLLGLAAVVAMRLRHPAAAHALWLLALIKLVTPAIWSVPIPWPQARAEVTAAITQPAHVSQVVHEPTRERAVSSPGTPGEGLGEGSVAPLVGEPSPSPLPAYRARGTKWEPPPITTILGSIWVGGSGFWLLVLVIRTRRFTRLARAASDAPAELQHRAEELALHLGLSASPRVELIPASISPMLWQSARATRLLLPEQLLQTLNGEQRDALLLHELAHLKRGDHLCRLLEVVVTGIYWWHPLTWLARRGLREAEEQCCDAWVMWAMPASARSYADALVDTLDFLAASPLSLPPGASGLGGLHQLQRRLTMIFTNPAPRALSMGWRVLVLAMLGILPLRPVWSQRADAPGAAAAAPAAAENSNPTTQSLVVALLEASGDPDQNVREMAGGSLIQIGEDAVPALVDAAKSSSNPLTRAQSLRTLAGLLERNSEIRRRFAGTGRGGFGSSTILGSNSVAVARSPVTTGGGGGFGGGGGGRNSGSTVPFAPRLGGRGRVEELTPPSADALALQATIAPAAISGAADRDVEVRRAAAALLPRLVDQLDVTLPVIIQGLSNEDEEVRRLQLVGLQMLLRINGGAKLAAAVPALTASMNQLADPQLRSSVIETLGQMGPPAAAAFPELMKALKDPEARVRSAAAWAIGQIQAQPSATPEPTVNLFGQGNTTGGASNLTLEQRMRVQPDADWNMVPGRIEPRPQTINPATIIEAVPVQITPQPAQR